MFEFKNNNADYEVPLSPEPNYAPDSEYEVVDDEYKSRKLKASIEANESRLSEIEQSLQTLKAEQAELKQKLNSDKETLAGLN